MFKLEFDAANKPLAAAIGAALVSYGKNMTEIGDALVETADAVAALANEAVEKTAQELKLSESAGIATQQSTSTEDPDAAGTSATAETNADVKRDLKGVAFNADYCGNAAKPFYGSGKKKDQWKKKQGVDEDAYDEWYATELLGANIQTTEEDSQPIDTAAAFSNNTGQETVSDPSQGEAPTDAGELMAWVSEQQTAGHLTPQDVQNAYTAASVAVQDLFDPSKAEDAVKAVYGELSAQVGK